MGSGACRQTTRPGGIYKFVFLACDVALPAMTAAAFQTALEEGDMVASGKVLASKAKGNTTKQRTSSCDPERVTQRTSSVPFKDFNADNTDFSEYDFWNDKFENQDSFLLGYTTCDELFYGWTSNYALEVDDPRPETSQEAAYIEGTFELNGLLMIKPVKITGINAVLQTVPEESA